MTQPDDNARIALIDALNEDLRRKSNELFRYAINSHPHVPRGEEFFLEAYERLIPIDDDNAESLLAAIQMLDGIPSPGVWDLGLADMNYLNVRALNQMLLHLVEETLGQLESHLPLAEGFPRVAGVLQTVVEDTRHQIEQLKGLAAQKNRAEMAKPKAAEAEKPAEE